MKYGESAFDILYLLTALTAGIWLLRRRNNRAVWLMGWAVLILGAGDAFHLVPRVLNYFLSGDFTAALGIGKLVTSITMTVFYVLMYAVYRQVFRVRGKSALGTWILVLAAVRIVLCLLPQNGWLTNESSVLWGVIRNIPFVILGGIIVGLFYKKRREVPALKNTWLLVTLSFLFYIPVAVAASLVPMLGMLMLPKTVCYILLIVSFCRYAKDAETA